MIAAIVAMSENRVIGANGKIPWSIPEDMRRFKELTTGHTVLMGRKTYESLPKKFRPLPDRRNVVVTRNDLYKLSLPPDEQNVEVVSSAAEFIEQWSSDAQPDSKLWIIGGGEIYKEALPYCQMIYLTLVQGKISGDTYFPNFEHEFKKVESDAHDRFSFLVYKR